jgi:hypothetical protein
MPDLISRLFPRPPLGVLSAAHFVDALAVTLSYFFAKNIELRDFQMSSSVFYRMGP